jgi:hypothetical protein
MAKRNERYFDVIVESYESHSTAGLHGPVHIRPIEGQPFPTHLRVECSMDLVDWFGDGESATRKMVEFSD